MILNILYSHINIGCYLKKYLLYDCSFFFFFFNFYSEITSKFHKYDKKI